MQMQACAVEQDTARHLAAVDRAESEAEYFDRVEQEARDAAEVAFREIALSGDMRKIGALIEEQGEALVNESGRQGYENVNAILAEAFVRQATNEKRGQQVYDCTWFVSRIFSLVSGYYAQEAATAARNAAERGLQ